MLHADDLHPMRVLRRLRGGAAFARAEARTIGDLPTMQNVGRQMNFVIARYNDALTHMPFDDRPANNDVAMGMANEFSFAVLFVAGGRNCFMVPANLVSMLMRTDAAQVKVGDIELPFRRFYIAFEGGLSFGLPGSPNRVDGAYVVLNGRKLGLFVTTRSTTAADGGLMQRILHPEPRFLAYLDLDDPDMMLDAAIEKAIADNEIGARPPDGAVENLHAGIEEQRAAAHEMGVELQRPEISGFERDAAFTLEALPVGRRIIALLANVFCYLSTKPDLDKPAWPAQAPRSKVHEAKQAPTERRRAVAMDRLADMGLFAVRRLTFEGAPAASSRPTSGSSFDMTPHWRRGHWRRQPHGLAHAQRRLTWIKPVLVRGDLGETPKGRIYELPGVDDQT